jgi:hypothetical protein
MKPFDMPYINAAMLNKREMIQFHLYTFVQPTEQNIQKRMKFIGHEKRLWTHGHSSRAQPVMCERGKGKDVHVLN